MNTGTAIVWAAGSLLTGAAAATASRSLRGFSRSELEEVCRRRKANELPRNIQNEQPQVALTTDCIQAFAAATFLAALATFWAALPDEETRSHWSSFALLAGGGGAALTVAMVWIPSAIARLGAVNYLYATWPVWRSVARLLTPLTLAAQAFDDGLHKLAGRTATAAVDLAIEADGRGLLPDGHRDGQLEEDAREMIEGVIQLGDAEVSQVMTPRTYMLSLRANMSLDDAVKFVISSGHTRIPVSDKNRDDMIGILHLKDLLPELVKPVEDRAANVANLVRPALFVPETKRLDELLEEFQQTRNHMAIVLDEYGGVSGLVTIEDVLEEIVGEIADEYDDALVEGIKNIDDHTAEALARVRIEEVNERLGIHLPDEGEFDTIGGFVFSQLGHIPAVGETVTVDDARLTVLDVTRRRIERVRIEVLDPSQREIA